MIKLPSTLFLFGITVIILTIVGILFTPTCYLDSIICLSDDDLSPEHRAMICPGLIDLPDGGVISLCEPTHQTNRCLIPKTPIETCSSAWDDIQTALTMK